MLISINWIRDYVDLPGDLDPRDLAERFTRTTAEVDAIEPIKVGAKGLIAAKVLEVSSLPKTRNLRLAVLDVGDGKTVETVTAAPVLNAGSNVVYAPEGASVASLGTIAAARVADRTSCGMILPAESLGIAMAVQEAVFLDDSLTPGEGLTPDLFDDWVIEVDNKSITNRPDLWGHYGVAREIAAILGLPLRPYPVVSLDELTNPELPTMEISIADPGACRRYSGLVVEGVPTQPAPLWMQLRLGHAGMRPISGLVDLTNYIMADLGQPMHAFDAAKVERIEVDWAKNKTTFTTLDGVERKLTDDTLMILCGGRPVALAGVMGGMESEVSDSTTALLLESANFDPVAIRRTATRLGLRTDASARFEKSLDPAHTALAIQRFIELAKPMYPKLTTTGSFSDEYPTKPDAVAVRVNPKAVEVVVGREVCFEEMDRLLSPLEFDLKSEGDVVEVGVPSFRATGDVSIEADVIEEIARRIGYDNLPVTMPRVSIRKFEPNAIHDLENSTLEYFTSVQRFNEIQGYIWYDTNWFDLIGGDPGACVELKNPATENCKLLRRSLMPGLFSAVVRNRHHFSELSLVEFGSVFEKDKPRDAEFRHVGLVLACKGQKAESRLIDRLKGMVQAWAWQRFGRQAAFSQVESTPGRDWECANQTAGISLDGIPIGRISVIDRPLRRKIDEHLAAWAVAWAELRLSGIETLAVCKETPIGIPPHPLVEMDFSILVKKSTQYGEVSRRLSEFSHDLLKRVRYMGCYEGDSVGTDRRSLTFRTTIGHDSRTLVDDDASAFRSEFEKYCQSCDYETRR